MTDNTAVVTHPSKPTEAPPSPPARPARRPRFDAEAYAEASAYLIATGQPEAEQRLHDALAEGW